MPKADPAPSVTVAREDFLAALAPLLKLIERRTTIPILGNIRLALREARLELTGSDLDSELTVTIDVEAGEAATPFQLTATGAQLHDIVRRLEHGARMTLAHEKPGAPLILTSGRARFSLHTFPYDDFPSLAFDGEVTASVETEGDILSGLFKRTEFAMSDEASRYYLCGVAVQKTIPSEPPGLVFVATNGHVLSRVLSARLDPDGDWPSIIVPKKTVGIIRQLGEARGEDAVTLSLIGTTKIKLEAGRTTYLSKLVDGTFPDWRRVVPEPGATPATIVLEAFAAAADRVTTMASERGRAVKINLDGDRLQLSVSNPDAGEANDEIGMDYRGPALEIGLNGRYIRDACQAFVHAEAALHIADASSPARLSPKNDTDRAAQDHEIVIMPIRV